MKLSRQQRALLRQLATSNEFVAVHKHACVLQRLFKRDLVFPTVNPLTNERLWKITERGRKLIAPLYRKDGLCPRCGKVKRTNGGYCTACKAAYQREKRPAYRSKKPCARCKAAERQIFHSGRQSSYCAACNVLNAREADARRGAARQVTVCPTCRVNPRHVQANGVIRSYCKQCEYKRGKWYRIRKARYVYGS